MQPEWIFGGRQDGVPSVARYIDLGLQYNTTHKRRRQTPSSESVLGSKSVMLIIIPDQISVLHRVSVSVCNSSKKTSVCNSSRSALGSDSRFGWEKMDAYEWCYTVHTHIIASEPTAKKIKRGK